jgi:hypothetical protein
MKVNCLVPACGILISRGLTVTKPGRLNSKHPDTWATVGEKVAAAATKEQAPYEGGAFYTIELTRLHRQASNGAGPSVPPSPLSFPLSLLPRYYQPYTSL